MEKNITEPGQTDGLKAVDLVAARRAFIGALGVSVAGSALFAGGSAGISKAEAAGIPDQAILNFALQLEYLEAEFYNIATHGVGLPNSDVTGTGQLGGVKGGRKVTFATQSLENVANEIANDERLHVQFLRSALGSNAVARPQIDFTDAFAAAGQAAGFGSSFDAFADENNFALAAFLFEDVGVTAYKGAAPLISNSNYLSAAAGILGTEAYHAGIIRTFLYYKGFYNQAKMISDARDSLDGASNDDFGIGNASQANLVPTDANGIVFGRTPQNVLNIVYLNPNGDFGGFFPKGVNGYFRK